MPTYQFECKSCKTTVSVNNSLTEGIKIPICFKCEEEMARVFTAPGVSFKGNGWGSDR